MGAYDQGQSFDSQDMQEYEPVRVEDRFAGHTVSRPLNNKSVPQIVGAVACAAFAIMCLSGFSYVLFLKPSQGTTLVNAYRQGVAESFDDNRAAVSLPLYIPELDNKSSRVPIKLTGVTKGGESINKDTYVSKDGSGLRLEPGSYEISVVGMPIASSGVVYSNPAVTISVEVGEDFSVSNNMSDYITFSPIGALAITDEQIDAACAFVRADPERTQYTDQLAEAARERREEAQKEEEAAKKAREEAERIAAEEKDKLKIVESDSDKQKQQESQPQDNNRGDSYEGDNNNNQGGQNDNSGEQQGGDAPDSGGNTGGGDSGGSGTDSGGSGTDSGGSGSGTGGSDSGTSGGDSGTNPGGSGDSGTSGGSSSETPSGGTGGGTPAPAPAATTTEAAPAATQTQA